MSIPESSGKAHHSHYEIREVWWTRFAFVVTEAKVLSQGQMETTGDTSNCVRSPVFQRAEVWGAGHQWLNEAFEIVVNGTSMERDKRGIRDTGGNWALQETKQGTDGAQVQKGREKMQSLYRAITVCRVLSTHLCPQTLLQTANITFVLRRRKPRFASSTWSSGRLRTALWLVVIPTCRLVPGTRGNGWRSRAERN